MKTTALSSPVEPESTKAILKRHLRETNLHLTFIERMLAKPSLTDADWKTIHRRTRKQRGRQEGIEFLAAAHPDEAWVHAYISAVKTGAAPDALQNA